MVLHCSTKFHHCNAEYQDLKCLIPQHFHYQAPLLHLIQMEWKKSRKVMMMVKIIIMRGKNMASLKFIINHQYNKKRQRNHLLKTPKVLPQRRENTLRRVDLQIMTRLNQQMRTKHRFVPNTM